MKRCGYIVLILILTSFVMNSCGSNKQRENVAVLLQTSMGDIRIKLSDLTPKHRDNFVKLVEGGYYDGLLFHRVIEGFMIQGGDPDSKDAPADVMLGSGGPKYTIPAEFNKELFHRRGAVAAARQGDNVNPTKASSGSQFYIAWGQEYSSAMLDSMQMRYGLQFSPEQRDAYMLEGGVPHLDGEYTVFGQVTDGMNVIDQIQRVRTDMYDRPIEDVCIVKASIVE